MKKEKKVDKEVQGKKKSNEFQKLDLNDLDIVSGGVRPRAELFKRD